MKIRKEFKIGVFAVAVILVSWWGIKWLQGQNLLLSSNSYYAYYEDVSGLMVSSRVMLRGVQIGNVQNIELEDDKVRIEMLIEDEYAALIQLTLLPSSAQQASWVVHRSLSFRAILARWLSPRQLSQAASSQTW